MTNERNDDKQTKRLQADAATTHGRTDDTLSKRRRTKKTMTNERNDDKQTKRLQADAATTHE